MDKEIFAKQLRKYRTSNDLTSTDLAEKAGYSENHIRQLESGRRCPTLESLVSLCNSLKVTPDCLIHGAEPPQYKVLCELTPCDIYMLTDAEVHLLLDTMEQIAKHVVEVYRNEA